MVACALWGCLGKYDRVYGDRWVSVRSTMAAITREGAVSTSSANRGLGGSAETRTNGFANIDNRAG